MDIGLVLKVLQVTGLADNDADSDVYCVLSTGACRFTTRQLPARRSSRPPWPESFLLSAKDLRHASTRVLSPSPSKSTSGGSPDVAASRTSPVLNVELWSTKRWGSDAVTASGELLLAPFLHRLQPNGPPVQAKVALHKHSSKSGSKTAKANTAGPHSPGIDSGWVLGAESQCMVLEIVALAAPQVPMQLLGPVGSGRAEVHPLHSCSTTCLNSQRAVLHTSGGHLYQTPSVQLIRLTLHGAQGLHNLHVDPVAAAAAAAAISRLAAAGESPLRRTERARLAATSAVLDGTKVGKTLFNKTSSWFSRSKPSTLAAAGAAVLAASSLSHSAGSTAAAAAGAAGADGSAASSSGLGEGRSSSSKLPSRGATSAGQQQSRLGSSSNVAAAAASDGSFHRASSPAAGAAAAGAAAAAAAAARAASPAAGSAAGSEDAGSTRQLGSLSGRSSPVPPSSPGPIGTAGVAAAAARASEPQRTGSGASSMLGAAAAAAAANGADATAAAAAVGDGQEFADDEYNDNDECSSSSGGMYDSSPPPTTTAPGSNNNIEDPVSRLKQALQHTRTDSVDAEAVMAALEENGFHATDAPGGAFVYAKLGLVGGGDARVSRVVGLGPGGQAVWDQSFWLAVTRPAPAGAALEVELFASKDDKSRGRSVAVVKVPLHQLLQPSPQASSGAGPSAAAGAAGGPGNSPWFKSSHVLQASFSDHLHCTLSLTVEAADWDTRAELAGAPRALLPDAEACGAAGTTPQQQQLGQPAQTASSRAPSSPRQGSSLGLQQNRFAAEAATAAGSDTAAQQQLQQQLLPETIGTGISRADSTFSNNSSSSGSGSSSTSSSVSAKSTRDADLPDLLPAAAAAVPAVAVLDVAVKAFETRKPLDVFFVLLVGPYCLVSSTSHSTHHHSWGWHLQAPLTEPADMLTLALFARDDQAGGKKKVGASMLTMFSSSIRLVGKMRVRLTTLTPNTPLNLSLPLQGERTNLRAGHPSAAVAHLYCHLRVPQLLRSYLVSYFRFSACSPGLYLLAQTGSGPDSSLEALAAEAQLTTARWLEQQPPSLPFKVFRKVQDDGRFEFSLSRTRANWRRLIVLREAAAPAREVFRHLCSWESLLHSGAWYCVILLFGVYPSKVLSVLLLACCVGLARSAAARTSKPTASMAAVAAAPATAAAAAAAASASSAAGAAGAGGGGAGWQPFTARPPPVMCDPGLANPEEALLGSAVPTDPYTSLKQNYEGVVQFLTTVQNVLDGWAAAGERLQLAFSWSDQLATAVLLVLLLLLALGLWLLGLQVLVTVGLLWVFRHPVLRDPLPPPPANFVSRMPTQSDTMM